MFDCANRCGQIGQRFLAPMSHVKMMAAAQPFLSGAISKTVNLPNEATVDEVAEIYKEGWKLGLKAVALYRDGCKASQPLNTNDNAKTDKAKTDEKVARRSRGRRWLPLCARNPPIVHMEEGARPPASVRHRLPKKRRGFTQEAPVGGHKVFLRTGEYDDGTLGEIFIDMHKEGAAFRSLMNCFAISVSMGLQYGVPLDAYVEQFTFTRFEPAGPRQRPSEHQVRDLDHRLHLPRARRRVPEALRPRARAAARTARRDEQPDRRRCGQASRAGRQGPAPHHAPGQSTARAVRVDGAASAPPTRSTNTSAR